MPRINAPTVGEHRAAQQRALLDAAREVLAEGATDIPSFGEVAARAGLARSSMYQYFKSRQHLLDALIEDAFPRWSTRVAAAMADADSPEQRVLAYIDANLTLVAEGEHAIATALAQIAPGPELDAKSRAMHEDLYTPLSDALRELGVRDVAAMSELVNAVLHAASRQVERGEDLESVRRNAADLVGPFVTELAARRG
ncbi:TetR/AcrR family transcriptional regulator [Rhodococcus sp. SGAir0479]|uniref:TetR/AcrR family transcriptional regulator n=1 Tax=Rhodococcus sp. SGAir0479 TaxID=2567884 RepID=UPI0010CCFB5E|nr:TetR/AcrR family transcriptional regulator [Rhodococcus sp. SGAir0479]QCQ93054.1 TetR/AcrR family transcriptional regulator [Rhodococcus sp. SGAir0479]